VSTRAVANTHRRRFLEGIPARHDRETVVIHPVTGGGSAKLGPVRRDFHAFPRNVVAKLRKHVPEQDLQACLLSSHRHIRVAMTSAHRHDSRQQTADSITASQHHSRQQTASQQTATQFKLKLKLSPRSVAMSQA
jgi:hypothetical protein